MPALSFDKFLELKKSSFLIDTRQPEIFARCYLKDAVNIPGGSSFCSWAGMCAPNDQPLILILENEESFLETKEQLSLIGLKNVLGYVVWDRTLELEFDSLELLKPTDAHQAKDIFIVDVRTLSEWNLGHIQSAHHLELSKLKEWVIKLPENKKIATICGSGFRSSIAASILQKKGFEDVASIQGGMQSWRRSNLPIASENLY